MNMKLNKGIWDYDVADIDLADKHTLVWFIQRKITFHDYKAFRLDQLRQVWRQLKLAPHWRHTLSLCFKK
jgi:hypothetical protein